MVNLGRSELDRDELKGGISAASHGENGGSGDVEFIRRRVKIEMMMIMMMMICNLFSLVVVVIVCVNSR